MTTTIRENGNKQNGTIVNTINKLMRAPNPKK